ADEASVVNVQDLCRRMVIDRLKRLSISRITLDFDGSVLSTTSRKTEGTAVGFNKKRKGARSYYPLFCTVAQTGQVLDFYHRPGNVHDSNGAREFILRCIAAVREDLPGVIIEVRMDSAFFSDDIISALDAARIEFTVSVPFERFAELKEMIEKRKRWKTINGTWSYFESGWKPKSWSTRYRFLFIRQTCKQINKEPIQLDLFIPHVYGYEFKAIITNKSASAKKVLAFHNGRGSQESVFGELKSQGQMDYIAVRGLYGNQLYMLASILAHNLNRELQMATGGKRDRGTTEKRAPLFKFEELRTIRHRLIQRAGRLTRPSGTLTLTLSANETVRTELLRFLDALAKVA
ncbi:MAG: transposase, partial [Bacteroidota bacterium]